VRYLDKLQQPQRRTLLHRSELSLNHDILHALRDIDEPTIIDMVLRIYMTRCRAY